MVSASATLAARLVARPSLSASHRTLSRRAPSGKSSNRAAGVGVLSEWTREATSSSSSILASPPPPPPLDIASLGCLPAASSLSYSCPSAIPSMRPGQAKSRIKGSIRSLPCIAGRKPSEQPLLVHLLPQSSRGLTSRSASTATAAESSEAQTATCLSSSASSSSLLASSFTPGTDFVAASSPFAAAAAAQSTSASSSSAERPGAALSSQQPKGARKALFARLYGELRRSKAKEDEVRTVVAELKRRDLLRGDPRDVVTAVGALGKANLWQDAVGLLDDWQAAAMEPNLFVYNTLMTAVNRGRQWQVATKLFDELQKDSLEPDRVSYVALLSAYAGGSCWSSAVEVLRKLEAEGGDKVDVTTFSAAMTACERGHAWQQSLHLFNSMRKRGLKLDRVAFNAAISACGKGHLSTRAAELLVEMKRRTLTADQITYTAAITAVSAGAHWRSALDVFQSMKASGAKPSLLSANAALGACKWEGRVDIAKEIVDGLHKDGLKPDDVTYSTLIMVCSPSGNWQLASRFLQQMSEPDMHAMNAYLGCCAQASAWQESLAAFSFIRSRSIDTTPQTYKVVLDSLAQSGRWAEALSMFEQYSAAVGTLSIESSSSSKHEEKVAAERLLKWASLLELQESEAAFRATVLRVCQESSEAPPEVVERLTNALQEASFLRMEGSPEGHPAVMSPAVFSELPWQVALSQFDRLVSIGTRPDVLSHLNLLASLLEAGEVSKAVEFLREARAAGFLDVWKPSRRSSDPPLLDLHLLGPVLPSVATLVVQEAILTILLRPSPPDDLIIVTGRGSNSRDGISWLQPAVREMLADELRLEVHPVPGNAGRLCVPKGALYELWSPHPLASSTK